MGKDPYLKKKWIFGTVFDILYFSKIKHITSMKSNIHPKYYPQSRVVCSCGNTFTTGSTKETLNVEVCYKCHPFYTGEHRFLDVKGRVDTFQKKQEHAKKYKEVSVAKKQKKHEKKEQKTKTLRELLGED